MTIIRDLLDTLLHRLPRYQPVAPGRIERLVALGLRVLDEVPPVALEPRQKMALGGYLFWEGPTLVALVARGLSEHRDLFPEIPADPAQMEQGLLRAACWRSLRDLGLRLAFVADQHCVRETAPLVKEAMDILRHVRADRGRTYKGEREARRARAMAAAEALLSAYKQRLKK